MLRTQAFLYIEDAALLDRNLRRVISQDHSVFSSQVICPVVCPSFSLLTPHCSLCYFALNSFLLFFLVFYLLFSPSLFSFSCKIVPCLLHFNRYMTRGQYVALFAWSVAVLSPCLPPNPSSIIKWILHAVIARRTKLDAPAKAQVTPRPHSCVFLGSFKCENFIAPSKVCSAKCREADMAVRFISSS